MKYVRKRSKMPRSYISFNLPEEQEEFEICMNASKYKNVLYDIDKYLRNLAKHHDKKTVSIEEVRNLIYKLAEEEKIDLY